MRFLAVFGDVLWLMAFGFVSLKNVDLCRLKVNELKLCKIQLFDCSSLVVMAIFAKGGCAGECSTYYPIFCLLA